MSNLTQPVPIQVQVANPTTSVADSSINNLLGGRSNEAIAALLHGNYYTETYRGNVFHGSTASAGVAIPASGTTSPTFGVWNPTGSGVNVVLIAAYYGWVGTTAAPSTFMYEYKTGVGSAIGTGAPISAFNTGTQRNGLLGVGATSKVLFTPAGTNTLGSAGTVLGNNGISQLTTTGTAAGASGWQWVDFFEGTVIIPQGVFLYNTASAAELSSISIRWTWYEFPV